VHRGQVPAIVISRRRHSGLGVWLKFLELCMGQVPAMVISKDS